MLKYTPALALALMPAMGLADPLIETVTAGNTIAEAPVEWLGETPHLVIMGTASGYPFNVQIMDFDADFLHEVEVKREYLLTGKGYDPYQEIDFGVQMIVEGVAKTVEAKLTHADFSKLAALPAHFSLQGENEFPEGDQVFTEFEFEWEGGGKSVNEELADWTGTAAVALDDGYGVAPTDAGLVGGYINASNGDDHIVISFTLDVKEFEVED